MEKIKIIKRNAETIISTGERIIHLHTHLGAASPLNNVLIADLNSRISRAKQKHEEGAKYKKLMDDAWRDRDFYFGNEDKGVISALKSIHNTLKQQNCNMTDWGL